MSSLSTYRRGYFPCHLWRVVSKKLSFADAAFLSYLWTCEHRNRLGFFRLPVGYIVADTTLSVTEIESSLERLKGQGLIEYDADAEIVLLHGYMTDDERIKANSTNLKGCLRDLAALAESSLFPAFLDEAKTFTPDLYAALSQPERIEAGKFRDIASELGAKFGISPDPSPDLSPDTSPEVLRVSSENELVRGEGVSPSKEVFPKPSLKTEPEDKGKANAELVEQGDMEPEAVFEEKVRADFKDLVELFPKKEGASKKAFELYNAFFNRERQHFKRNDFRATNVFSAVEGYRRSCEGQEPRFIKGLSRFLEEIDPDQEVTEIVTVFGARKTS